MPPGRPARQRLATNENDENSSAAARITRAKAASLHVDELNVPAKPLQPKKAVQVASAQPAGLRKRAALGDVSNVTKVEVAEAKKVAGKAGLVSKAAQPTGIQKNTSRSTGRTALSTKEASKKTTDAKKSGHGTIGTVQKRKVATASASVATIKDDAPTEDQEPVRKKAHTVTSRLEEPATSDSTREQEPSLPLNDTIEEFVPTDFVYPEGVKDLDSEDLDDPQMVAEYAADIFEYLRDLECGSLPNPRYMNHQDELDWKTRGVLVDWLVEVHTRFHLLPETLFLAVNIVDRFLSAKVVQLDRLQLVGVTAMFIAAKYEEVLSPSVGSFRHVADDGFTEAEILSAERFMLGTLNYDLSYPNPMNFLRRVSKADNYDIQTRTVAKYLTEISLLDHRFMSYRPSHVAAAAMFLARLILDRGEWDATLSFYAGYTEDDIEPVAILMVDYLARPSTHEAFFKKYATSLITRQWAKKNAVHFGITDTDLSVDEIS
ncbi:G2/mitotic-specific cyclin 1/2 [Sporothrix schenckii 1099-18]|uniref:G2/mitotic-specific cyclin 1/2 n=1 Tax=Sporothrix schenckii 1099-18 TaxID=1397361 RepID=A0A0F2M3B5_SPOSC|nr:G2/mitotic-specific cyclin 1/2 [Sporothrix schenckii 1099-18]KJR82631.1 G2/mitotic-specific cyclin 1/2 [Sporothrix schenckii 1099-18]